MPRVGRNRSKHLRMPVGWEPKASGIYFVPTNKADQDIVVSITGKAKCIRLGATFDEAVGVFDKLIVARRQQERRVVDGTVSELCDRARRHYLPKIKLKNKETHDWRARHLDELERHFGMRLYARNVHEATKARPGTYLVAMDIQRHIDENAHRPVAVNRAVQTWRIVWKEARRRWGLTEYNPCEGLQPNEETPRDNLPDDRAHFFKVYRALDPPARFVLALGRYYGRRPGEARRIETSGIQGDGVHTIRGKRARELILEWDDDEVERGGKLVVMPGRLRKMVARAMRWRERVIRPQRVWRNGRRPQAPRVVSTKLLINRRGRALSKSGFASEFRRAMAQVGLVEVLGEELLADGRKRVRTRRAFNPNDTRAKRASTLGRQDAVEVLAHDDERTTEVHYRRGPKVIEVPRDSELANSQKGSGNSRKAGSGRS